MMGPYISVESLWLIAYFLLFLMKGQFLFQAISLSLSLLTLPNWHFVLTQIYDFCQAKLNNYEQL